MNTPRQLDSEAYIVADEKPSQLPRWMKVTAIAAVSAVAGGLAAAWFYRKTLATLQNAENLPPNPEFRIPEEDFADDL